MCFVCKRESSDEYVFSCSHKVCLYCLIAIVLKDQINSISYTTEKINVKCKCSEGELEVEINSLSELVPIKYQSHPLTCKLHSDLKYSTYCKDCKILLCDSCLAQETHSTHQLISIIQLAEEIKKTISNLKFQNFIDLTKELDKNFTLFLNQITFSLEADLSRIDSLIKKLEAFKEKLSNELNLRKKREEFLFKLIKFYYERVYDEIQEIRTSNDQDFYTLKSISKVKLDVDDFKVENNDTIVNGVVALEEDAVKVINSKNLNISVVYPYFGLIKEFKVQEEYDDIHSQAIKCIGYLPLTNQIATGSYDRTIKVFKLTSPKFTFISLLVGHASSVNALCSTSKYLVSGDKSGEIKIWNSSDNFNNIQNISHSNSEVNNLAELKIKEGFLSSFDDGRIRIYQEEEGNFLEKIVIAGLDSGVTCSIQMKNEDIISGDKERVLTIWRNENEIAEDYRCVQAFGACTSCLADFKGMLIAGLDNFDIAVYSINENKEYTEKYTIPGHAKRINKFILLKDGRLASCSFDKSLRIWRYDEINDTFVQDQEVKAHKMSVYDMIELKNGKLITVGGDLKMIFWKRIKKI